MDAQPCTYCLKERGSHTDHLITRNQARRNLNAARHRQDARFKVKSCPTCNWRKGTRLRVPVGYAFTAELEALTGDRYAEFDGTPESLREVVK